jgi:hypothetical protein
MEKRTGVGDNTINVEGLVHHPAKKTEDEIQRSNGEDATWNLHNYN